MRLAEIIVFSLATGACLGVLYLLFLLVRLLFAGGKAFTALCDLLFCALCAVAVFLCALAVAQGRLRAVQAFFQLLGGWAMVTVGRVPICFFANRFGKIRANFSARFRCRKKSGTRRKNMQKRLEKMP